MFLVVAACGGTAETHTPALFLDDFADSVQVGRPATRIVSLNPVTTEIFFAIGAGARLVGRTHFDLYPDAARAVPDLGDGMRPNVEAVIGAHPDLVVLYASNTNRGAAEQLRRAGIATLALRTDHISDFRRTVRFLARAVGDTVAGNVVADSVERSLRAVRAMPRRANPPAVFWFIWETPLYTIGRGSYMSELLEIAGAANAFGDLDAPSPQVTFEELAHRNPRFILTGPVNAARVRDGARWKAIPAARAGRLLVVDTALVGRPGPRLGEAARHLRTLILGDTLR